MDHQHNSAFHYTYSAEEQAQIKHIRSKYVAKEESKIERLQRLDASATQKAAMVAIVVGVVGTLVMGLGMSLCMAFDSSWFIPGIVIGVAGLVVVALAYPLYNHELKKQRQRIAPQILQLTDELLK